MTGGLMQLVAYGAQDIYLTGNPTITHFKVIYRRHTNFSTETVSQTFDGVVAFGNRVSATITRNGDLIRGMYIQANLPALTELALTNYTDLSGNTGPMNRYMRWVDNIGHHMLQRIDIEIGGQLIDRQYGDWLDIWAQLTIPAGKQRGYYQMIGQDPLNSIGQNTGLQQDIYSSTDSTYPYTNVLKGRDIYVPLQFWFCRNVGLALPLIALQYHDIKITVQFRPISDLVTVWNNGSSIPNTGFSTYVSATPDPGTFDASLWVDYVYLDTDERQRFAKVSHEYLIEQVQFTGDEYCTPAVTGQTVGSFNSYRLNFNHPVKELIWAVRGFESSNQWSNYTDTKLQAKPPRTVAGITSSGATTVGLSGLDTAAPYTNPPSSGYLLDPPSLATVRYNWDMFSNFNSVRPTGRPTGTSSVDYQSCRLANNPVVSGTILLNGQERFAARPGSYFNLVQPKQYHTNIPQSPGINVYSFAIIPEEHQPSGTCNFSRIDNATLNLYIGRFYEPVGSTYTQDAATGLSSITTATVKIYAFSYNILRITNGMGGLAYSN